ASPAAARRPHIGPDANSRCPTRPETKSRGAVVSGRSLAPPADAVAGGVEKDAAVEVDDLPLHPGGLRRAEEGDQARDLLRLPEGAERRRPLDLLHERSPVFLAAEVERHRIGVDVAWVHAVDGDAARPQLDGEIAGERLERGLRRGEDTMAGDVAVRVHAGDGD